MIVNEITKLAVSELAFQKIFISYTSTGTVL